MGTEYCELVRTSYKSHGKIICQRL